VQTTTYQLEAGGVGVDQFTVSEYFPAAAGGTATAWGTRYGVYAEPGAGSAGYLYVVDLRKGTAAAPAAAVQMSSGTITGLKLCPTGQALFDNYRFATLSWIVYHAASAGGCASEVSNFVAFQLSMTATSAPLQLQQTISGVTYQVQPVEALYDAFGTITGFLAIGHAPLVGGAAQTGTAVLMQLDANLSSPKLLMTTPGGSTPIKLGGLASSGFDFRSLGISTGGIWLYADGVTLYSINLSSGAWAQLPYTPLPNGDALASRAVFDADGVTAYVSIPNSVAGAYVLQIATGTGTVTATTAPQLDAAAKNGITLVGPTSQNLVYLLSDGSGVRSLAKGSLAAAPANVYAPGATKKIDGPMPPAPQASPVAFIVGDTVYFTVADPTATASTAGQYAKQAYSVTFSGATPGAANPLGGAASVSAVLGAVAPSSIPTTGPIAYAGVIAVTGGNNTPTAGTPAWANGGAPVNNGTLPTAASIGYYGASGMLTNAIGNLTQTNAATGSPLTSPITFIALNPGPLMAGTPAMLGMVGTDATLAQGQDIAIFSSDNSTPFGQESGFSQSYQGPPTKRR
jgi:hypothetical protein